MKHFILEFLNKQNELLLTTFKVCGVFCGKNCLESKIKSYNQAMLIQTPDMHSYSILNKIASQ